MLQLLEFHSINVYRETVENNRKTMHFIPMNFQELIEKVKPILDKLILHNEPFKLNKYCIGGLEWGIIIIIIMCSMHDEKYNHGNHLCYHTTIIYIKI